jgi:S-adenosylmethionine hydrolase
MISPRLFLMMMLALSLGGCGRDGSDPGLHATIALLTDYGTNDPYVPQLKGAILTVNPAAHLVDLTHEVEAFNVRQAAYLVDLATMEFPVGTIVVAVVDPGVGTTRKQLLIKTKVGKYYVGPDNGIFSRVVDREGMEKAWSLDQPKYYRNENASATFHGRDIFGPVAGHLSRGVSPDKLGTPLSKLEQIALPLPRKMGKTITGEIVHVDHYGNIVTNIPSDFSPILQKGNLLRVTLNGQTIPAPFIITYNSVPVGRYCLVVNSGNLVEFAINQGSAASKLKAQVGQTISLQP